MKYLILLLALTGCTTTVQVDPVKLKTAPPRQPSAVKTQKVTWEAEPGKVWLTPEDGVKVNAERKDMIRYIKELQLVTCSFEDTYTFCKDK